eukprot:3949894-Pleurochrysis_carterae.AAC.2
MASVSPLKRPLAMPSDAWMLRSALEMDGLIASAAPEPAIPETCMRRRTTLSGYVAVCARNISRRPSKETVASNNSKHAARSRQAACSKRDCNRPARRAPQSRQQADAATA